MYTYLPDSIDTVAQAEAFIFDLIDHNELWHLDDDPADIPTLNASDKEIERLHSLQDDLFSLAGENVDIYGYDDGFDPHGVCVDGCKQVRYKAYSGHPFAQWIYTDLYTFRKRFNDRIHEYQFTYLLEAYGDTAMVNMHLGSTWFMVQPVNDK